MSLTIQVSNIAISNSNYEDHDDGKCSVPKDSEEDMEQLCFMIKRLNNIGEQYKTRGKYQDALRIYKKVYYIQRENFEYSHPEVCSTLLCIAEIHYDSDNYTKALEAYERGLQIQRELFGDDHLDAALTLNSIALVLFKLKIYKHALRAFEESLSIRQQLLGPNHVSVGVVLFNIAAVYIEVSDYKTALTYYNAALDVERATLGENHKEVALTLEHIGYLYQQQDELNEAIGFFLDAVEIYQTNSKITQDYQSKQNIYFTIAQVLNTIGNMYLQRGETQDVMLTFSEALRYFHKSGKDVDELTISGLNCYIVSRLHPECAPVA